MILLAGMLLARQALPTLGGVVQSLTPLYAANRLLAVTSVAASAGTTGAPVLLAAAVRHGTTLAVLTVVARQHRRQAVTVAGECGCGSDGEGGPPCSSHGRTRLRLLLPLLLAVDASQFDGGMLSPATALDVRSEGGGGLVEGGRCFGELPPTTPWWLGYRPCRLLMPSHLNPKLFYQPPSADCAALLCRHGGPWRRDAVQPGIPCRHPAAAVLAHPHTLHRCLQGMPRSSAAALLSSERQAEKECNAAAPPCHAPPRSLAPSRCACAGCTRAHPSHPNSTRTPTPPPLQVAPRFCPVPGWSIA